MKAKIKLISLIIIIGIIMLIFPKFVNAKIVKLSYSTPVIMFQNSSEGITLEHFIGSSSKGYYAYEFHGSHIFANEFMFCVKPEQSILGGEYYYSNEKYILKEGSVEKITKLNYKKDFNNYTPQVKNEKNGKEAYNFARGLAYILSFYKDSNYSHDRSGDGYNRGPLHDEVNLALWAYLDYVRGESEEAKNFFGIESQGNVDIDSTNKTVSMSLAGDYEESKQAYTLYIEAKAIFDGYKSYKITGEFYKLTDLEYPGQSQDLVFPIEIEVTEEAEVPEINLDFYKVDYNNNKKGLSGAELKIESVSNVDSITKTTIKSAGTTGKFDSITIKPNKTNPGTVKIKITETKAPDGYGKLSNSIELTIAYDKKTGAVTGITENSDYITTNKKDGVGIVYVKNKLRKITNLTIAKTDIAGTTKLQGTKFTLYLNNIKSVKIGSKTFTLSEMTKGQVYTASNGITLKRPDGDDNNNVYIYGLTTNSDGEITIPEIMAASSDIIYTTITEEKSVIGYKKLPTSLRLVLRYDGEWKLAERKGEGGLTNELNSKYWELDSGNNLKVKLKNEIEVIELSGRVWIDGQDGIKNASYNGKCDDSDKKVEGVEVCLVDSKGNKVVQSGLQNPVYTDENGEYKFENVIVTKDGFKVQFKYNGIMYKGLGNYEDSDAVEVDRNEFNAKFKTITAQGALSTSNAVTSLKYDYTDKEAMLKISDSLNIQTAVSASPVEGSTYVEQAIIASTTDNEIYNETTENIDCGLLEKYFDLKVDNLIDKVEYKINGKDWVDDANPDKTKYDTESLQKSDYYYRFDDYGETKKEDFSTGDNENTTNYVDIGFNAENELTVDAYYNLNIINQSIHEVSQVVIKYTYDNNIYSFNKIGEVAGVACEAISDKELKITVSNWDKNKDTIEIPIIFELKKDENILARMDTGLEALTTAEIISYTTKDGGLIDNDSEPGNGKEGEDDLSQAKLTFKFAQTARKISGNVAEDTNKDGTLDSTGINDVIVQLIEVIEKNGNKFEYIWQETTSGSSEVKARGIDKEVYKYKVENNPGQYQFLGYSANAQDSAGNSKILNTGFIPGDYIVRFIYGDGTTYDLTDNVTKYNGQDYKSTIDMNYQAADYNPSNYNGKSTARDNEARRLQVIAFSTEIDGNLGVALKTLNVQSFDKLNEEEQELLKQYYSELQQKNDRRLKYTYGLYKNISNPELPAVDTISDSEVFNIVKHYISYETWMCAETSKIEVKNNSQFTEVNFGLAKRPETKLTLEKHITSLKITPTGTGVQPVVDAKADITQILKVLDPEDTENISIKTSRSNNRTCNNCIR